MEPYHKGSSSLTTRKYYLECLFQGMIVEVGFEPTKHYATDLKPASFNHSETQLKQGTTVPLTAHRSYAPDAQAPLPSIIRAKDFNLQKWRFGSTFLKGGDTGGGDRTLDHPIKSRALVPLSYTGYIAPPLTLCYITSSLNNFLFIIFYNLIAFHTILWCQFFK